MNGWIGLGMGLLWAAAMRWLARRNDERWKDVGAGGLLALFVVAFFWRTLSGDVYQPADGGDLVSFLFPTYRFAARTLSQGDLPLWNPHLYAGAPFISDIQAGFLYLPNLILFLLKPDFPYPWMQGLAMAHLWWAGLGVYVLVRVLGFSRPAALLAGTAFQFSDPLLIHLGNYNLIAVLSWIGWVLAAYHLALVRRSLRWAGIAALLFAAGAYAGHAQSTFYVGLALGLYTLWLWGSGDWALRNHAISARLQHLASNLPYPLTTGILTLLLTAPILLPSLELIQYTARAEFSYQDTVGFSLAPVPGIAGLLTPGFFGRGPALHWSLWDRVELPYAGVPTLLLAAGALLLPGAKPKWRRLLPWIGLALFGFVVALGIYAPVHGWLTQILPGFGQFRAPARAIVLFTLGLSVLAAAGLDALVEGKRPHPKGTRKGNHAESQAAPWRATRYARFLQWGGLALLLLVTPLMYASLLVLQADSTAFLRASLAALAVALATLAWLGTWLLVALFRRRNLSMGWFAGLLIALLLAELSATGAYTDVAETNPAAKFEHPEIIAFLQSELNDRAPGTESAPFRIDTRTGIDDVWQPDTAALAGLHDVGGIVNPLALRHWEELWNTLGGRETRLYDMLNVKYVIVKDDVPLPAEFDLAFDAPGPLSVYANPDPLPRAWLVQQAITETGADQIRIRLQDPEFDPGQAVLLQVEQENSRPARSRSGGPRPGAEEPSAPAGSLAGAATILTYTANEMTLAVQAGQPGYLVLSELWYPGWRATVDGAEAPVLRANGALRAVPVPAGASTVRVWFAPPGWRWGLALFALGVVLFALVQGGTNAFRR